MIYLDNEGKIKVDESASIKEQGATLFTPEVKQNFLEILGERIGHCQPIRREFNLFDLLKNVCPMLIMSFFF